MLKNVTTASTGGDAVWYGGVLNTGTHIGKATGGSFKYTASSLNI